MEHNIICPSGLAGKIRPLCVSDEPVTQDVSLIKSGGLIYELCKRCWVHTDNKGPYVNFNPGEDWSSILQGDAFWVFLQIRRVTYGDSYDFSYKCDACNQISENSMMFSSLEAQEPSEAALAAFQSGGVIKEVTESGQHFTFKLLTAADEKTVSNYEKGRSLSRSRASMCVRLVDIAGLPEQPFAKLKWVESLPSGMADEISEIMESHDCGVDTDLEVACKHCGYEQEIALPFGPNFLKRKRLGKKEKKALRKKRASLSSTSDGEQVG